MKLNKIYKELGLYFRNKRLAAKLSQAQVSSKLGYSNPQFVSNFERGLCAPPLPKIRLLMELYGISMREMTKILLREQKKYLEATLSKGSERRTSLKKVRSK